MAASAWIIFDNAKHALGNDEINLSADTFRLALYSTAASANITGDVTIQSSIGSESSGGGYPLGGTTLASTTWVESGGSVKFDCTDPIFTASSSVLSAVRYAAIVLSLGATSGLCLCYAPLSTANFNVSTGNTLTVQMDSAGIFVLS